MQEPDTNQLLARYIRDHSEEAFTALVALHINMVYSTALRQVGNLHQAEEITQAVFLILAKKAGSLSQSVILSGWLYRTARLTAANYLRSENRRHAREQEAHMQSLTNEGSDPGIWAQLAPHLDAIMAQLDEKDQNVLVLRFFEEKSFSKVGLVLGTSEDAAKMRVGRALERLRKLFARRDIALSASAAVGVLSASSAKAAPASLTSSIAMSAMAKGVPVSASTLTLMKSTLKIMTWLKIKTAVLAGTVLVLTATTVALAVDEVQTEPAAVTVNEAQSAPAALTVDKAQPSTVTQSKSAPPSHPSDLSASTQDDFAQAVDKLVVPFLDLHQVTLGGAMDAVRDGCARANPGHVGVQFLMLSDSSATFDLRLENVPLKSALNLMASRAEFQYRLSPLYEYHFENDGSFKPHLSKIVCVFWAANSAEQLMSRTLFVSENGARLMQLPSGDVTHAFEQLDLQFPPGGSATFAKQQLTVKTTGDQILQIIAVLQAADSSTWHATPGTK